MGIRTDPGNPNLHYLDCRPDGYKGKRVRETFSGTREEAEAYYRAMMQRPDIKPLPTARALKELWPEYVRHCEVHWSATTVRDFRICWERHLCEYFGALRPKQLTRPLIEAYKQRRLAAPRRARGQGTGVKPKTITKELHYISGMINWAAKMGYCEPLHFKIEGFPAKMLRAPKPHPLMPDQVAALLAALRPAVRLPVLLMVDAGLRASEAQGLKREQVNLERGILYVVGKGAKERVIPITTSRLRAELERAVAEVDRHRAGKRSTDGSTASKESPTAAALRAGYLTVNPKTGRPYITIKKSLMTAARQAGIEQHVYQHLLRHTFGTLATTAGVAQAALQNIMGHSSPVTTGIYQTLAAEQLRQQTQKFGAMMDAALPSAPCPDGQMDKR